MNVEEAIVQKLRALPLERQREVLEFMESLETKSQPSGKGVSALALAGALVGGVDGGPGDLATNPKHLKEYGKG